MEIQSITWYTVYKQQYTKSLTQFEQLQDSIPNLLECSIGSVRLSFGLQKQMKESVVAGAWSDSWSSNVLGLSRIREAGFLPQLDSATVSLQSWSTEARGYLQIRNSQQNTKVFMDLDQLFCKKVLEPKEKK